MRPAGRRPSPDAWSLSPLSSPPPILPLPLPCTEPLSALATTPNCPSPPFSYPPAPSIIQPSTPTFQSSPLSSASASASDQLSPFTLRSRPRLQQPSPIRPFSFSTAVSPTSTPHNSNSRQPTSFSLDPRPRSARSSCLSSVPSSDVSSAPSSPLSSAPSSDATTPKDFLAAGSSSTFLFEALARTATSRRTRSEDLKMGRSGTEGSSKAERGPPQKEKKQRMEKRGEKEKTGKKEKKKEQLKKVRLLKKTRSAMSRSMPVPALK
jgi:hypothetical protein